MTLKRSASGLAEYRDSAHTLRSYQREISRLLFWAVEVRRKPLSSLNREDYKRHVADHCSVFQRACGVNAFQAARESM